MASPTTSFLPRALEWQGLVTNALGVHDLLLRLHAHRPTPSRRPQPHPAFASHHLSFPLYDYAMRLVEGLGCSSSAFVVAHVLLRRAFAVRGDLFERDCLHKLMFAACVVATKWVDDETFSDEFLARVGGVGKARLRGLELAFLSLLGFRVFVSREEFDSAVDAAHGKVRFTVPAMPAAAAAAAPPSPRPKRWRAEMHDEGDAGESERAPKRARGNAQAGTRGGEGEVHSEWEFRGTLQRQQVLAAPGDGGKAKQPIHRDEGVAEILVVGE